MAIYEVVSGGDRQSLFKRFMHKSKMQAISELVDIHLLHCRRIEKLEAERDAALARVEQQERTIAGMNEAHAKLAGLYEAAQAQHSVPDGWVQSLPLKDHQPCKSNEDRANGYVIPIYSRPVPVEEALRKLRAVLCDPVGNVVIDGSDGDREEVQRALGILAAAPGKEGV
ncbi:TPA: hypothetical protein L5D52_001330 [Pseudomonas aeruginosa]|nr:hypothetical protein [Pseudomonas aeruginosa]